MCWTMLAVEIDPGKEAPSIQNVASKSLERWQNSERRCDHEEERSSHRCRKSQLLREGLQYLSLRRLRPEGAPAECLEWWLKGVVWISQLIVLARENLLGSVC